MSEEELVKFCEELFDAVDEDGSGAIDLEEYKRFAQMINKSESDALKEWQGMNLNEDAELTKEALMAYLRSQQATKTAAGDALINVEPVEEPVEVAQVVKVEQIYNLEEEKAESKQKV